MRKLSFIKGTLLASLLALLSHSVSACPSINGIGNVQPSNVVGASFSIVHGSPDVVTYKLDTVNRSPTGGIPGVIEYCVYPADPPGNPTGATAIALGFNGTPFMTDFHTMQGYFEFQRGNGSGNNGNIPLNGATNITVGTANWPQNAAPSQQTILLHINDPVECNNLYGNNPGTCFVLPALNNEPPELCNGNPACKQVTIDEAITSSPLKVPTLTKLHIHYQYTIVNQPSNNYNMIFYPPTLTNKDINNGGGSDNFSCEQIPDPAGQPGGFGVFPNYQGNGWNLNFFKTNGACNQSRLTFTLAEPGLIVLLPGQSISWTVDMVTRENTCDENSCTHNPSCQSVCGKQSTCSQKNTCGQENNCANKGTCGNNDSNHENTLNKYDSGHENTCGKYEYTTPGSKLLNCGFTVKWYQSDDNKLHSFKTNPIYVQAVSE